MSVFCLHTVESLLSRALKAACSSAKWWEFLTSSEHPPIFTVLTVLQALSLHFAVSKVWWCCLGIFCLLLVSSLWNQWSYEAVGDINLKSHLHHIGDVIQHCDRLTCFLFIFFFYFVPNILFKIILQRAVEVCGKNDAFPVDWMLGKISVGKKAFLDFAHFHFRSKEMFVTQIYKEGRLMSGFS